ncbi:MAG: DNA methyltransferase, partial [Nanoarchaeota archaeon]|nr:DNA methyltransferase [Nanoarchaeota archaeon]
MSNKLICGDCIEALKGLPENSVDIIVTSPPYNLSMEYSEYEDFISHEKYMDFNKNWIEQLYRVSKSDGRFCLNIPFEASRTFVKNGTRQTLYSDYVNLAKEIGWKYKLLIVWNKANVSRRTAWGCYDERTRVMTKKGLKYFKDVTRDDEVMTLNKNTKEIEYQKPFDLISYDYEGDMVRFKHRNIDLLVTPNHNMFGEFYGQPGLLEAEKFLNEKKSLKIPQHYKLHDGNKEEGFFSLPPIELDAHAT